MFETAATFQFVTHTTLTIFYLFFINSTRPTIEVRKFQLFSKFWTKVRKRKEKPIDET